MSEGALNVNIKRFLIWPGTHSRGEDWGTFCHRDENGTNAFQNIFLFNQLLLVLEFAFLLTNVGAFTTQFLKEGALSSFSD